MYRILSGLCENTISSFFIILFVDRNPICYLGGLGWEMEVCQVRISYDMAHNATLRPGKRF